MQRRHRRDPRVFSRPGATRRTGTGLSDSAEYWPLTIVPSTSKPRRSVTVWLVAGAIALLGAGLTLALRRGIPAW